MTLRDLLVEKFSELALEDLADAFTTFKDCLETGKARG